MKRPVPIVLTAIFLGLLGALQLLAAVSMAGVGIMLLLGKTPRPSAPTPFPSSLLPALMLVASVFTAAIAVWFILTLIGLVRLRSWARYSTLTIAGLMAFFGGISAICPVAMPYMMPALPAQPGADPHLLRGIFLFTGAVYAFFTLVGIALFVYFNLASVRVVFAPATLLDLQPPKTVTGKRRPTAITVIAWFYLACSPFCLLYAILPFPALMFGFLIHGVSARLIYLAFGTLGVLIGYGLLQLHEPARRAVFILFLFCPLQTIILLTPWGREQFRVGIMAMDAQMYAGVSIPDLPVPIGFIIFMLSLTTAVYGGVLWLLHRHRDAFVASPPPPPMPPHTEALPSTIL